MVSTNPLKHAAAAKPLERLGNRMFRALLRPVKRFTDNFADLARKGPEVVAGGSDPFNRL